MNRFSLNGTPAGVQKQQQPLLERNQKAHADASPLLDIINERFIEAEKRLKALQPWGTCYVVFDRHAFEPRDFDQIGPCWYDCVGLTLHEGQWRLCVGTCDDHCDVDNWQPVIEAPKRKRLEVAKKFPALFANLQELIVKKNEDSVPEAMDALKQMIIALS